MIISRNSRTTFAVYVAAAAFVVAGCGGGDEQRAGGGFQMPPLPVEVATVQQETVLETFNAVGTVDAENAVTIVSEIDGTVESLPFEEGGTLEKGDVVARLDDDQLAADVARNEALVAQHRATYERVKDVVDEGAGPPQDLDDANANLKVAEANLRLARSRWRKTQIRAPFSGLIGARLVSPGTFVRAGQPIASMAQVDELRIGFSVPERFLSRLAAGAEVSVTTPAYPATKLTGVVAVVEPVLDADTRTARAVARVRNTSGLIRPGMSANVSAVLAQRENALTLDMEAIFANGEQSFVYTIGGDSTVTMAPIQLGTRLRDRAEIVGGLKAGDNVVRAGHQKLFPGAKVLPMSNGR